jgi:exo-beta-1,3-glucanase (GH17 family)
MTNIYPSDAAVGQGPAAGAREVATTYDAQKAMALAVNPNVQVLIGETGWPSQGISFNDPDGHASSPDNEKAYYDAFTQWANTNSVASYYFEAIDEPWKSDKNVDSGPKGRNGAEGHFGLYTYNSNTDTGQFVPKFAL